MAMGDRGQLAARGLDRGRLCHRAGHRPAAWEGTVKRLLAVLFSAAVLLSAGCGYHTAGHATRLPDNVRTIAVPAFVNQTQTYRVGQLLTRDVVRELISRTKYRVINESGESADATLTCIISSAQAAPLTYDAQSGRVSSAVVTVAMKVTLTDRSGHVLFENLNYSF